jgi:hypothetical protein
MKTKIQRELIGKYHVPGITNIKKIKQGKIRSPVPVIHLPVQLSSGFPSAQVSTVFRMASSAYEEKRILLRENVTK